MLHCFIPKCYLFFIYVIVSIATELTFAATNSGSNPNASFLFIFWQKLLIAVDILNCATQSVIRKACEFNWCWCAIKSETKCLNSNCSVVIARFTISKIASVIRWHSTGDWPRRYKKKLLHFSILRLDLVGQQSNVDEIRISEWRIDSCGNVFVVVLVIRFKSKSVSFAYGLPYNAAHTPFPNRIVMIFIVDIEIRFVIRGHVDVIIEPAFYRSIERKAIHERTHGRKDEFETLEFHR